jgi:hypothetical protein
MTKLIVVSLVVALFVAACGSSNTPPAGNNSGSASRANATTNRGAAAPKADDVPAAVKAAVPSAQSFTAQHKDLTDAQIASIEKDTGGKMTQKDHHSYLAFSVVNGARTQVGAATVVKAGGKEIVIVYDSKDGSPVIKEVKADGMPAGFLAQFTGKGHDDDLLLGADIKANGVNEDQAKAIVDAIRIDVLAMQALYGKAHTH